jgi:hypothetical protein
MHGEQNSPVYQKVAFGRSDIAPVSLLAEDRAGVLERRINGAHCNHCSHLQRKAYRRGCRAGAGALVLTVADFPLTQEASTTARAPK